MLQSAPHARMIPMQFEARGAPLALVPGWRYLSEAGCDRAPPAECLADVEIVFEASERVAELPSCTAPDSWFCPPEA